MTELTPPRFEGTFRLKDGRKLGYAEYGSASGRTILWFHGTPGARRQVAQEARDLARKRRVRLIAIERPGIGDSSSHSYPSMADWAEDIDTFCHAKGIQRFAVCGLSGGGPYALACAYYLQDKVVAASVLGGLAPSTGQDAATGGMSKLVRGLSPVLARLRRPMNRLLIGVISLLRPHADRAIDTFAHFMPPGDQAVFADPAIRAMFQDDLLLGSREQMQAIIHDAVLFGRDWGFPLDEVEAPVYLLYGDADIIVPVEHGEHLSRLLPNAEFRVREGEGHLGGLGASREIFDDLLAHWPRR